MFRRILVPTDLTDRTAGALEAARRIAASADGRITLLHVIETIPGMPFEELATFYASLEKRARVRMNDFVGRSAERSVSVVILYGRRVEEVLKYVAMNDVDLIVLASHPPDASQPSAGLGTMSYKLGVLARCAVLLVK